MVTTLAHCVKWPQVAMVGHGLWLSHLDSILLICHGTVFWYCEHDMVLLFWHILNTFNCKGNQVHDIMIMILSIIKLVSF
jgi:hypothetical protein